MDQPNGENTLVMSNPHGHAPATTRSRPHDVRIAPPRAPAVTARPHRIVDGVTLTKDALLALCAIAWADGWMSPEEQRAICDAASLSGLDDADFDCVVEATTVRSDLLTIDPTTLGHAERMFLLAVALWIARVDGRISQEELSFVDVLADYLDLDGRARTSAMIAADEVARASPLPGRYDILGLAHALGRALVQA
jgi:hypothetical protein